MLIAAGVAIAKKVKEDRERKKIERQGVLKVGDSDEAERAFGAQSTKLLDTNHAGVKRAGTDIKYDDPGDVQAATPAVTVTPTTNRSDPTGSEAPLSREPSVADITSQAKSEKDLLSPTSTYSQAAGSPSVYDKTSPSSDSAIQPPPYSPREETSAPTIPVPQTPLNPQSFDHKTPHQAVDKSTTPVAHTPLSPQALLSPQTPLSARSAISSKMSEADTKSISTRSTNSNGTHAIRVKTKGADLKSGFVYHPALFDLRIHPEQWTEFTDQVIQSTKLGLNDQAKVWATAGSVAVTGFIGTSVWAGRTRRRTLQEKKVKAGLTNMSDGGLGELLQNWNDDYFGERGLFVHLELSESAMKNVDKKSTPFRKGTFLYKKEERERKRDERKYVVVVTKLDEDGQPTEAMQELAMAETGSAVEIGSSATAETPVVPELPGEEVAAPVELPGEDTPAPVELPADTASSLEKQYDPTAGYVEMDGDNTRLLDKLQLEDIRVPG